MIYSEDDNDESVLGRATSDKSGKAQWETMGKIREIFDTPENVGEIEYEAPILSRKQQYNIVDEKTGKVVGKGGTRSKAQKSLKPGQILVEGNVEEKIEGGPYIRLDPPWPMKMSKSKSYPNGIKAITGISFFTWTSKMSAPSFSLPGGPTGKVGGTCPAAVQEAVEKSGQYKAVHEPIPAGATYVCNVCYTGKNNYLMYKMVSVAQTIRRLWVDRWLRQGWTSLAQRLTEAIGSLQDPGVEQVLKRKAVSNQYFRIHDAGDFYTPDYYIAWRETAYNLPDVKFWAPTRQWVFEKWRKLFANYPPPENMSLRPSSLFFGARPPVIEGMNAGTTAAEGTRDQWYDFNGMEVWNCPAYAADEHSCATAINPDGGTECRTCWSRKEIPVNYKAH
jgi:hypothetical protein